MDYVSETTPNLSGLKQNGSLFLFDVKSGGWSSQAGWCSAVSGTPPGYLLFCGILDMWLSLHGSSWLLELQPSLLHSSQQGGGKGKEGCAPSLAGYFLETFCSRPISQDLVTWLYSASKEPGKCSLYLGKSCIQSSITREEKANEN